MKRLHDRRRLHIESLEARRVLAASLNFLGDLATGFNPAGSSPGVDQTESGFSESRVGDYADVNGVAYFSAHTQLSGDSLWRSNGTAGGTVLLRDGITPHGFVNIGGTVFFSATDGKPSDQFNRGEQLWKTNGTTAGTLPVAAVDPNVNTFTNLNGVLYFSGTDSQGVSGLFKSDGTGAGTQLIASSGKADAPSDLVSFGGSVYFDAPKSSTNTSRGLWKSDGTAAGTVRVDNLATNFDPSGFAEFQGSLFFAAAGLEGRELWKTNGTTAGTVLVKDIDPGNPPLGNPFSQSSFPSELTAVGDQLFFTALPQDFGGRDLWVSDGSSAGTHIIASAALITSPMSLTAVGDTLYFVARKETEFTYQLWASDGTLQGTQQLSSFADDSRLDAFNSLVNVGGTLFFSADDPTHGRALWRSNGTQANTILVKDILPGPNSTLGAFYSYENYPSNLANIGGKLFFSADNGLTGAELYKSDGTEAGTRLVKDLENGGSRPADFVSIGTTTFFTANFKPTSDDTFPRGELWRTDGTIAGTLKVVDIFTYKQYDNYSGFYELGNYLTNVNGTLFFATGNESQGIDLWKSDGTAAGTTLVKDISPGAGSSAPKHLTNVNGTLLFSAYTSASGRELWRSNGTPAGTNQVVDLAQGDFGYYDFDYNSSFPSNLTNIGGKLYFDAQDAVSRKDWKSDGTAAGTVKVSVPPTSTPVGKTFFYIDSGPDFGATEYYTLMKSDGVLPAVEMKRFPFNFSGSGPEIASLTNVGGTLYFAARDASGSELWKSNGTVAGTVRVKDLAGGGLEPEELVNVGGQLFFTAADPAGGRELWKSDGTATGTFRVKDIRPGALGSLPQQLTNVDGRLYFAATATATGNEIWKSDGTANGTVRITDIASGLIGSHPSDLTAIDGTLFFSAGTPASGREPYALVPAPNAAPTLNTAMNPNLGSIQEGATAPLGTSVKSLLGTAQADADSGALQGIAVTAASQANGRWQFSLNNGATWREIGNASETDARLLSPSALVRFIPQTDFSGQVKLFYRAWDQTQGFAGGLYTTGGHVDGSTAFSLAFESATLTVTGVNDPPKLGLGGTLGYTRNAAAIRLAAGATVTDIDNANFAGGRLRVRITNGSSAANRLLIGAGFSIDASNNVRHLGTNKIIGRRTINGAGTNELVIAFNVNAKTFIVEQLVRSLTFKTVGGAAGQRKILFTVSDGKGGVSPEATKFVNVT